MNGLESLEKNDIKELLSKGWITHDAMWFLHSLKEVGMEKTNRINRLAVESMAAIEVARLKKALGFEKETVTSFDDLVEFLSRAMDLVLARFMRFKVDTPARNVIHWEMEKDACFAYKGISGMGVIDQYHCGVLYRIENWLRGLGVAYEMRPPVTNCLMHATGECKGDFILNLS
ncbi:MAG: DUF6125 family protein [Thermodesulfobacteriota bacterium]